MADRDVMTIMQLVAFIKTAANSVTKAAAKAQVAIAKVGEVEARKNAKKQFTGRNGRRLSGTLLNSIFSTFESTPGEKIPTAVIGVRNIPYAAIHEFGGEIEPVKAKHLWIPQYQNAGKMTPREFIRQKMRNPSAYFLNDKVAGKWANPKARAKRLIPLFFLVDKVSMPARPYLTPAVEVAVEKFPRYFEQFFREEVRG